MQTRVIRGSRRKAAVMFAVAAALGGMCLPKVLGGSADWRLQACLVGLGLFALIFLFLIIRPVSLTLSATGFEWRDIWGRPHAVEWRWIEELSPWRMGRSDSKSFLVGYTLRADAPMRRQSSVDRGLTGFDGALPGPLEVRPEELLELTRQYHAAATAA